MSALAAWTLLTTRQFGSALRCTRVFLVADLLVGLTGILLTSVVDSHLRVVSGQPTLPGIWTAGTVLAFAIKGGWRWAAASSAVVGVSNIVERGRVTEGNVHSIVLLFLVGTGIGYVLVQQGLTALKSRDLGPRHTVESLREDARWAKEQVR